MMKARVTMIAALFDRAGWRLCLFHLAARRQYNWRDRVRREDRHDGIDWRHMPLSDMKKARPERRRAFAFV